MNMNRQDLLDKMGLNDPNAFINEFKLIDPNNLPKPNSDGLYTNDLLN